MFMAYLIHAVELTIIALSAVLALQINRCYRAEYLNVSSAKSRQEPSLYKEPPMLEERIMLPVESLGQSVVTKKVKHSEAILNDYIGEFFGETSAPTVNIEEYRVAKTERVVTPVVSAEDELADDIITVMEEDHKVGQGHSVMSEKVVHAMLDEAKVVCPS